MISEKKLTELKTAATQNTSARKRLTALFDEGSFRELDALVTNGDGLTGVITAYGYVEGNPVYAFSQDSSVKNGAVGKAHAAKIIKLLELAAETGAPVVGIHDSNGAFLDGGVDALSAYGEMLKWMSNLSGVVPQIAVIAGTCAGSAAMMACSCDFVIMTEKSEFFMTPPFETSKTAGAGTAKNAAKAGTANIICKEDIEAVETARKLVAMLPMNNLSPIPLVEFAENTKSSDISTAEGLAALISDADSILELSKDFGKASYTALATVSGATVGVVATNKTADRLTQEDCAKLARFVRTCDAFSIPIITFVDSEGFASDAEDELAGSIRDMTKLAHAYAEATTVKISVITGKAYGPVYVAMAGKNVNADITFAYSTAVITPLAPETAVEFLKHDELKGAADVKAKRKELAAEYAEKEASALLAAEKGCVNEIIDVSDTRVAVISALEIMAGKRVNRLPKKHSNMPF